LHTDRQSSSDPSSDAVRRGQAIYTPITLRVYDAWVLGFSNSLLWRCPTRRLLQHYSRHLSLQHLEAGVGTGYFPAHGSFPPGKPEVTLFDLNADTLAFGSRRLNHLRPRTMQGDLLKPIAFSDRFDSAAINYVLHCLPGDLEAKSVVFEHLKAGMRPGGVIFGSTLLSKEVPLSKAAQRLMKVYNRKGIFSNQSDSVSGMEAVLRRHFERFTLEVVGCAALFAGYC
jgi:SAM-dependent methyltransferase